MLTFVFNGLTRTLLQLLHICENVQAKTSGNGTVSRGNFFVIDISGQNKSMSKKHIISNNQQQSLFNYQHSPAAIKASAQEMTASSFDLGVHPRAFAFSFENALGGPSSGITPFNCGTTKDSARVTKLDRTMVGALLALEPSLARSSVLMSAMLITSPATQR